jgi:hypothetical protein
MALAALGHVVGDYNNIRHFNTGLCINRIETMVRQYLILVALEVGT